MINLNIAGVKYKLPTKITEISYRLGTEIESIVNEYDEINIETKKWILAALLNVDYDIVDLIHDSQIELVLDNNVFFDESLVISQNKYIKVNKFLYEYRDFEPLTIDEYAQRELDIINEDNEKLFFSLYKKLKWYQKPFIRLITKNNKDFNDINYYQIKLSLFMYNNWKNDILNEYSISSHNDQIPEDQQDDEYILSAVEQFGVYHVIMGIVNDDIIAYKQLMNDDIRVLFKYILYQHIKNNS